MNKRKSETPKIRDDSETDFGVETENSEMLVALANRIRQCAELAGSGDALAQRAGIPRRTLETYLAGEAEPKILRLTRIARAAGVDVRWLATGEGSMRVEPSGFEVKEGGSTYEAGSEFVMVPRYNVEAAAGAGMVVEGETEIGKLAFRRDWLRQKGLSPKDLVVIRVSGDSMTPTIRDGALVLVDRRQDRPREDGIYVLIVDGHLVAKRLQLDLKGGLYVRSDNSAYREQHFAPEEAERLAVIGRIIWAGGEI